MVRRSRPAQAADGDGAARQITFNRRKKLLLKKAMELSVLCDCAVAVVVFGPDGQLVQFSGNGDMDKVLERYARACSTPHERYTNEDLLNQYAENGRHDDVSSASIAKKRALELDGAHTTGGSVELVGPSGQSIHVEGIKPAGFMDDRNYPLSPSSEKAHKDIGAQFDQWMDVLNTRDGAQDMDPGGQANRFKKNLSVMVPDMSGAGPLVRGCDDDGAGTGAAARDAGRGGGGDDGAGPASARAGGGGSGSGSGGPLSIGRLGSLGMSELMSGGMPSPGGLLFGADVLFTSRGGLNLDLPTPDSTSNVPLSQSGFEWPSSSRDSMLPGFSDNETGEELPGGLMVTGRGLKTGRAGDAPLGDVADRPAAAPARAADGVEDALMRVSGVKVSGMPRPDASRPPAPSGLPSAAQSGNASSATDDFPGFSNQGVEPTDTPMCEDTRNGIELPLDV